MLVRYQGSPYHKRYPSQWGAPKLRSDKTECPPSIEPSTVIEVFEKDIVEAMKNGHCSLARDGEWPRYVWGKSTFTTRERVAIEVIWEARVENRGIPEYKAYPITRSRHHDSMPPPVEAFLWPD